MPTYIVYENRIYHTEVEAESEDAAKEAYLRGEMDGDKWAFDGSEFEGMEEVDA